MKKKPASTYTVENCNVTNQAAPVNEHTRSAIEALANAATANANAIAEIAKALKGSNATIENGIRIGQ